MATVTVRVPGLLSRFTDGERRVQVEAGTVRGVLENLVAEYPALEPHLFDNRGNLRTHLQLFDAKGQVKWEEADEVAVKESEEIVVLQAVSGG